MSIQQGKLHTRRKFDAKYLALVNKRSCRGIAQAVSRWFPTAVARVRARVCSSGAGAGFLRVLRFPLPIFIPPNSPSSLSPGAGTIGHSVADVPSGPSLNSTPHYANLKKKKKSDQSKCTVLRFGANNERKYTVQLSCTGSALKYTVLPSFQKLAPNTHLQPSSIESGHK
jgi:hypothetical protein